MDIRLEDYQALILVFGMKGCPACDDYLPIFRKVAAKHPTPAFAIDCLTQKHVTVADTFRVTTTPTTFLLRRGKVVERFEGEGTAADVERLFKIAENS